MNEGLKSSVLALFKVPPEPEPPAGLPSSVRIFRAARNFFALNVVVWALTQAGALAGIIVALSLHWEQQFDPRLAMLFRLFEYGGLVVWVLQVPVTYFVVRLDYEMRWYIVTDRSLRIRHGIQNVREMTMTFANIQQITVQQGPLQRLLGLSDLQVRTAGGGGSESGQGGGTGRNGGGESMHLGFFRGVDNAEAIRDLIVERLRRYRDAGLGDPDDELETTETTETRGAAAADNAVMEAASELANEARLLRETVDQTRSH